MIKAVLMVTKLRLILIALLLLAGTIAAFPVSPAKAADDWQRVGNYGLGNDISSSGLLSVFNDQLVLSASKAYNIPLGGTYLYVLENDNWVLKKSNGLGMSGPYPTALPVGYEVFNNELYLFVTTYCHVQNGDPGQTCKWVWRSSDLANWTQAAPPNFGPGGFIRTNFQDGLEEFNGQLLSGIGGTMVGSTFDRRLYVHQRSSDSAWPQKDNGGSNGFGQQYEGIAGALFEFGGSLFLGGHRSILAPGQAFANIYRSGDGVNWTATNSLGTGFLSAGDEFEVFNGELYTTITRYEGSDQAFAAVYKAVDPLGANPSWQRVSPEVQYTYNVDDIIIDSLKVFDGRLFFGTYSRLGLAQVWSSANGTVWNQSVAPGFGEDIYRVSSMEVFNGSLYAVAVGRNNGTSVWRVTGPGEASMTIDLAPRAILLPDRFAFGTDTYTFTGPADNLSVRHDSGNGPQEVSIEKVDQDASSGGDERGTYYRITVSNIPKKSLGYLAPKSPRAVYASLLPKIEEALAYAPPPATSVAIFRKPYPFRITFHDPVPAVNLESTVAYLAERGNKDNVYFGNANCESGNTRSYLCLKETVTVINPNTSTIRLPLLQKISLAGVYVAGNVAAPVQISNIKLTPNAVAVGGQFNNVSGTLLTNYLQDNPNSLISWASVEARLLELYEKRTRGSRLARNAVPLTWYLNTPSNNIKDFEPPTTFSSPPEGKLWYFEEPAGQLNFNRVTIHGSGTVVIPGDVVFRDEIDCPSPNTRVGVIASGNITFENPNIDCGAYVALGITNSGDINFAGEPPAGGAAAKGIFIAKRNITIPAAVSAPYFIDYDTIFAQNPTVLFRELLTLIISAAS
jgi:hypothetical protein